MRDVELELGEEALVWTHREWPQGWGGGRGEPVCRHRVLSKPGEPSPPWSSQSERKQNAVILHVLMDPSFDACFRGKAQIGHVTRDTET